jgi:predicted RNA binding protein YcfA (HicA-like mRNA interferase family)
MNSREVIRLLQADGWVEVARRGSHAQFKHPAKSGRVTVPHPKRDLPLGTLRSTERQAGMTLGRKLN